MFDHVEISVADLDASQRCYRTALGAEPRHAEREIVEWDDWGLQRTDDEHPVSDDLHVAFRAPDRDAVDAF